MKKLYWLFLYSFFPMFGMWKHDARAVEFVSTMQDLISFSQEAQKCIKQARTTWNCVNYCYNLCQENSILFLKEMIKKDGETLNSIKPQLITSNVYCVTLFRWLITPLSQDKKNELLEYAFDINSYFTMLRFLIALGARITV